MSQGNYRQSMEQQGQVVSDTRVRENRRTLSPARVVGAIVGVILTVVGILAIVKAGLDTTLNQPIVRVAGLDMSAAVGIGFLVVGLILLLASATSDGAGAVGFFGVLLILFGVFAVAITGDLRLDVGVGRNTGWFSIILGAICLGAMFFHSRTYGRRQVQQANYGGQPPGTY